MKNNLIPKTNSRRSRYQFTKSISFLDLAILIIGGGLIFLISTFIENLILKITLVLILAVGLGLLFIPVSGSKRAYEFGYILLKYFFSKKRFTKNDFKHIDWRKTIKTDGNYFKSDNQYMCVFKLEGFNFLLMTPEQQTMIINRFLGALKLISKNKFTFYKLSQNIRYRSQLEQVKAILETHQNDKLQRLGQEYKDILGTLFTQQSYYLMIAFKSEKILNSKLKSLASFFYQAGLKPKILKGNSLLNFSKQLLNLGFSYDDMVYLKNGKSYLQTKNNFIKILTVKKFIGANFENGFLNKLVNYEDCNVAINVSRVTKHDAIKNIDKSISRLKQYSIGSKKASESVYTNQYLTELEDLLNCITVGEEELMSVNINIVFNAKTLKELNHKISAFREQFAGLIFQWENCICRQNLAWYNFLPTNNQKLINECGIDMPLSTLAGSFPFQNYGYVDKAGQLLGTDNLDHNVFLDFQKRDQLHVNGNISIFGKSGNGKSYFTKKILTNLIFNRTQVFIIDPEREYKNLVTNLNGKYLDLGSGNSLKINPLQIMIVDETHDNVQLINDHVELVMNFVKMLRNSLDQGAELTFQKHLKVFFLKNYQDKTISKMLPSEFKTFADLEVYFQKLKTDHDVVLQSEVKRIIQTLEQFTSGSYSHLWNHASNLNLQDNVLYCLDINSLLDIQETNKLNAQMYLSLNFVNNHIIKNYRTKESQKVCVVVDEAHLLVNRNNSVALDYLAQLTKRIRKYNGMVVTITQNVNDFMGDMAIKQQAQAIINNSQYSFIFNLNPSDLNDLNELYKASGGLNQEVKDFISVAERGQCFAQLNQNDKFILNVVGTNVEEELMS